MRPSARHRLPTPGWAGLTLLFVVLAGILGMHALDTHGLPSEATAGSAHVMPAGELMAAPVPMSHGPALDASHGFGGHGSMLGVCVGLVAGAALILLLARQRARRTGTEGALLRSPAALTRGRDPDPPSLVRLSVHRC